jgi:flagellar hook-basal body complex protein FliE
MAIPPITGLGSTLGAGAPGAAPGKTGATGFADLVGQLVSGVETSEQPANAAVNGMLNKTADVHDAMIALQRSELALQLVVQVRNKFVQAYQDIMRMPI